MPTATTTLDELTLDLTQELEIRAPVGDVYRCMLHEVSHIVSGDGSMMELVLEEWPGGRWFRDLGHGQGHLWGFVQVIKPPTLLEITGPMMMSYAVAGFLQIRIAQTAGGALVTLRHQAIGMIDPKHREGLNQGWGKILQKVKEGAEK